MDLRPTGITKAHLLEASIGEDYWECDFGNYMGPTSAKNVAKKYLTNLTNYKAQGIGIMFAGPPGPGKTTLAVIILKYLARANWMCFMTSLGQIVENIQAGWSREAADDHRTFLNKCRDADFLLIDDLGKEHAGPTGFSATVFDNLIRHRMQHRQPTFFTTNMGRNAIRARYGEALLSLVEGKCRIIEVVDNDYRKSVLKPNLEKIL